MQMGATGMHCEERDRLPRWAPQMQCFALFESRCSSDDEYQCVET